MKTSHIKPPEFLDYLHSFRGLAIVKIVFGHAVAAAFIGYYGTFDVSRPLLMASEIFYHDSTLYFALISGLLFAKILRSRGYKVFFKSKLKNILLPYVFFSLVLTALSIKFQGTKNGYDQWVFYISKVFINLLYGKANFVLWYIPVLLVLYVLTPVLDILQNQNRMTKRLFFVIIFMPLLVSRIQMVSSYTMRIETVIYFLGAYAFGMYLGQDLDDRLRVFKKHKTVVFVGAVVSTLLLFYLYGKSIDLILGVSLRESVFYIQKGCFSILFMLFLKGLGNRQPLWLMPMASNSFSIYFMHGYILYACLPFFMGIVSLEVIYPFNFIFGAIILALFAISTSMLVVRVFKMIFGKYSRMLIGA